MKKRKIFFKEVVFEVWKMKKNEKRILRKNSQKGKGRNSRVCNFRGGGGKCFK